MVTKKSLPVITLGFFALLAAAPVFANSSPSPSENQESADGINQLLASRAYEVVIEGTGITAPEVHVGYERVRGGTVFFEIQAKDGDDASFASIQLIDGAPFFGFEGSSNSASEIPFDQLGGFMVDDSNRSVCGDRDVVFAADVTFADGKTDVRFVGAGFLADGVEPVAERLASSNTSCPLDPDSAKCQNNSACVITISIGIISFDVDGKCLPQFPFGWPCLCDPLPPIRLSTSSVKDVALGNPIEVGGF